MIGFPKKKEKNKIAKTGENIVFSSRASIPEGYETDPVVNDLFNRIESTNDSFFITGKAGTGKSTFLNFLAQTTGKQMVITAHTGIAALNAGGVTIHSFFGFPFKPLLPRDREIPLVKKKEKLELLKNMDALIIDEISMVRSDILEGIDHFLRKNGGKKNRLFGGKQLILVGDPFQLPPVVTSDPIEKMVFSKNYPSEYFFDSPAFKKLNPVRFEFTKSHRQDKDREFLEILDRIRVYDTDSMLFRNLNRRVDPALDPGSGDFIITLTAYRGVADRINMQRLKNLDHPSYFFEASVSENFGKDKYPTEKRLELRKHAQVIMVKNDNEYPRRWVNGTLARVESISEDSIRVKLQNGKVYQIDPETWENRRYQYDEKKKEIVSEVIGSFTQFPVKLAWAITIHKSQGLTFDRVIIDLGRGAFTNGQVYTALSRCRTLDGITLRRNIGERDIIPDPRILKAFG